MQDLVVRVSKAPFNYPDKVLVKAIDGHNTCVLELRVAKEDIDKIIGREGKSAHSIGTIRKAAAEKMKKRVVLEISEWCRPKF